MTKIKLDFDEEEKGEEESTIVVQAGSTANIPGNQLKPESLLAPITVGVTSRIISPIPMNPAEMAKMLALGKEKFSVYEVAVRDLIHEAESIVVSDQATHDKAVELGLRAKKLGKEIKERKDGFTKHANDFVKGLSSFTKPFMDGCEKIERITKDKNRDYLALKELERRKQQKILEDAQKEVQKKVDAEAEAAGVETVQIQPAIVKEEQRIVTRTEHGSASLRAAKDCKVINLSLVPREYLERVIQKDPDKFLKPVIMDELKRNPDLEVPGVMIFDSTNIVYRT